MEWDTPVAEWCDFTGEDDTDLSDMVCDGLRITKGKTRFRDRDTDNHQ